MNASPFDTLLSKLDAFIRKYYKNLLLKGGIYFITIALVNYLSVSILEYYGRFNSTIRAFLFFSSLLLISLVLFKYVLVPLAGLLRIGKRINHAQASAIIGSHFSEVKDKLINTLQLKEQSEKDHESSAFIEASIAQRTEELRLVPFVQAIDFRQNARYLKYLILPVLVLVSLFFINAKILKEATTRLVHFDRQYAKEAPFNFILLNDTLEAVQNEDVEIRLALKGSSVPAETYLNLDGKSYKMLRTRNGDFSFTLKNVQQGFRFYFSADDFTSNDHDFKVVAKPMLSGLSARLEFPAYTRKPAEEIQNTGDFNVPQGTKITWSLKVKNTEKALLIFPEEKRAMEKLGANAFRSSLRILNGTYYSIGLQRLASEQIDSIPYRISVIPDAYPSIQVEEREDSLLTRTNYFVGEISDDYGFTALRFVYKFVKSDDPLKSGKVGQTELPVGAGRTSDQFYFVWQVGQLGLKPGDKLEYYFEVLDNDGINGAKRSISQTKIYEIASADAIKEQVEKNTEVIKKELEEALKETRKLGKDIQKLQRKMLEKKTLTWEEEKELKKLLDRQKELQQKIEELKQMNRLNNKTENEFTPLQEQLLQKQMELEKLFDELFSDELKQMMEEMQRLLEEQNKDLLKEELQKMELNEKELDKELDRMLEMYKRFEVEKKMEQSVEKLEELAKEQEKLAEETNKGNESPEKLKQKQDSLNNAFEELKKELDLTDSLNKELEEPMDFENPEEEINSIEEEMKEGSEELEKKQKKEAAKKQKAAAKKMKELAEKMQKEMEAKENEQQVEDYETLRAILENLIQLSFDQEDLIKELSASRGYNPKFVELVQRQKKLRDDARIVEDSLLALSKRSPVLRSYINSEMGKINDNLNKTLRLLSNRDYSAAVTQQYTMTSMNNLAVMLSEILKNMQDDMMNSSGKGKPSPKKSKPKPGDGEKIKQMQKELGDQLKKMKEGASSGGKQPGSKEYAQMAAKQEAIRRMLQEMKKGLQEDGKGKEAGELQKTIEKMEELEKDLVNKRLEPETFKRLQEIETRLLEHEKAEKEREQDEKRESREGNQDHKRMPPELQEYLLQRERENELLNTLPPELRPYYKERVRDYFREISR